MYVCVAIVTHSGSITALEIEKLQHQTTPSDEHRQHDKVVNDTIM